MALEETVDTDDLQYGRILARMSRQLEVALATVELSVPQYRVLCILGDGCTGASALAERLTVTRPTVTAAVDGLVNRSLVSRVQDSRDRRRVAHALTPEGELALVEADRAVEERLTQIADHLPDGDASAAFDGLGLWFSALEARRGARISTTA